MNDPNHLLSSPSSQLKTNKIKFKICKKITDASTNPTTNLEAIVAARSKPMQGFSHCIFEGVNFNFHSTLERSYFSSADCIIVPICSL